jgi:hypothetical protein
VAGALFAVAALLAIYQVIHMGVRYGTLRGYANLYIGLPFDWFLVLEPFLFQSEAGLTWPLVVPAVALTAAAVAVLVWGRRRPGVAAAVVAGALTVQNLVIWIVLLSGQPRPNDDYWEPPLVYPGFWSSYPEQMFVEAALAAVHVVLTVLPLCLFLATVGQDRRRRGWARATAVVAGVYVLWNVGVLIAGAASSQFQRRAFWYLHVVSFGVPQTWPAPLSTLACLAAIVLLAFAGATAAGRAPVTPPGPAPAEPAPAGSTPAGPAPGGPTPDAPTPPPTTPANAAPPPTPGAA